ncbi:DUF551 domain-containing protein [Escherichia coli]|uniref:DUF551 domain-containing protein n=1 Tax=Escherichia coli TaxID=562 RepID=UPI003D05414E
MKQMSLIEMDGFLKGKCIPSDLKVNETNAEYLVRKFGELESKLETALREVRSAGITIDNLEAKCAVLATENATDDERIIAIEGIHNCEQCGDEGIVVGEMGITRCACGQAGNSPVTPDGWISCSERMPEIRQTVIGWNGYAVRQCVYTRNEYAKTQKGREPRFEILTGIWHGVTHWMPLPEPPQEVNRG